MGFQTLNPAFLFEQLLLVCDLSTQFPVLLAQSNQGVFLSVDICLSLLQLCGMRCMQGGQFAAAASEGFQLLPAVETGLFALPVVAQLRQCLSSHALALFGLRCLQGDIGSGFFLFGDIDRRALSGELVAVFELHQFKFLLRLLLRGNILLQPVPLFKLLTPDT